MKNLIHCWSSTFSVITFLACTWDFLNFDSLLWWFLSWSFNLLSYTLWCSLSNLVIVIILLLLRWLVCCPCIVTSNICIFDGNLFIFLFNCLLSCLLRSLQTLMRILRDSCSYLLFRNSLLLFWRTSISISFIIFIIQKSF